MMGRVLRLTLGEWYKQRRRWLPWILLAVLVLISQAFLWGFYVVYHVSDEGSVLSRPYEYTSNTASVEVTCEDVLERRVEGKIAQFSGDERRIVEEGVEEWRPGCSDYISADENLSFFTLPASISVGLAVLFSTRFVILLPMVLAASSLGTEYGWGTLRTSLTKGAGRWHILVSKVVLAVKMVAAGLLVMAVAISISSVIAGIVPPSEGGPLVNSEGWLDAVEQLAKSVYALVPYVVLGTFFVVLTQSTAQGVTLSVVFFMVEALVLPPLLGLADWLENVNEALLIQNVDDWMYQGQTTASQTLEGAAQPDTLQAFLVILTYTVVLFAATLWLFQRRDVSGPRGE